MKNFYMMALAALVGSAAMAQVSVTFQVDMNNETVSPDGVHMAGNWQAAAGYPGDWQPNTAELTDDDADGIYTLTVDLPTGQYEYKFINGNDWPFEEGIPAVSQKGGGNSNRFFAINDWHANNGGWTMPANLFGGSAPAGQVAVRLQIDMANQEVGDNGVHVAGDAIEPNWTPGFGTGTNFQNSRYAFVTHVAPNATYNYKWINGNDWGTDENVAGDCADSGNRVLVVGSEDIITDNFCFGVCEPCAPQTEVTFNVDLSSEGGGNPDGVSVAGAFQGWTPGATLMTDDDGDGVYSVTVMIDQGTFQYKFINGIAWGDDESVPGACNVNGNREVVVGEEPVVETYCFNQCTAECVPDPDPANITFRVNMNAEEVAAEGVFVMGDFTAEPWQPGALQMDDSDGDGIYEVTVEVSGPAEFQYKFANGDPNEVEETGDFLAGGCGVSNGLEGFNRVHVRSGEAEVLDPFYYNSCLTVLSTNEAELGAVRIFPNPSNGSTFVEVENPNGYNLRMSVLDITGKVVRENILLNSGRKEINTSNFAPGMYFLNVTNEKSERSVYKLMVR